MGRGRGRRAGQLSGERGGPSRGGRWNTSGAKQGQARRAQNGATRARESHSPKRRILPIVTTSSRPRGRRNAGHIGTLASCAPSPTSSFSQFAPHQLARESFGSISCSRCHRQRRTAEHRRQNVIRGNKQPRPGWRRGSESGLKG